MRAFGDYGASGKQTWGAFRATTYPVPGNHEYRTPGAGCFGCSGPLAGSPERGGYSFDLGGWHVVALNSECEAVGGCGAGLRQGRWLEADPRAHPAHPGVVARSASSGVHGPPLRGFRERLEAAGAELVLKVYDHLYERLAPQADTAQRDAKAAAARVFTGRSACYTVSVSKGPL